MSLEIRVYLQNGSTHTFVQDFLGTAQKITASIQPSRLFTPPILLLGDDTALTAFPTSKIERLDLFGDGVPEWAFHHEAKNIRVLTEDEFIAENGERKTLPNGDIRVFSRYDLASGAVIYLEIDLPSFDRSGMLPFDQSTFIQQLFTANGLHARLPGGGYTIINIANVERVTFYPGPPSFPLSAWRATPV